MVYLNMFRFPADTLMPLLEDDPREGTSSTIDLLPHGSRTTEQSTSPTWPDHQLFFLILLSQVPVKSISF